MTFTSCGLALDKWQEFMRHGSPESGRLRGRWDRAPSYAAAQENSKFSGLRAPATNLIWTKRSPEFGDLLLSLAAVFISAREPFARSLSLSLRLSPG